MKFKNKHYEKILSDQILELTLKNIEVIMLDI